MHTILAGDIGGTKTILRLVNVACPSPQQRIPHLTTLHEQTYPSQAFPDLSPMIEQFLAQSSVEISHPIQSACFGIAGPVIDNTSELTNLSWSLTASRIQQEFGFAQVALINDFASVGYGVLGLAEQDLATLQAKPSNPHAPIAVIGAGTGLGEGFLIPSNTGYQVFPSEGGHSDFAPRTPVDFQLLRFLLEEKKINRVSVERVVSGQGIVSIYECLRSLGSTAESPLIAQVFQAWEQENTPTEQRPDPAAAIAQAALAETDALCQQTMALFIAAYGAEAGNLALKLLPYGGLYIAGGIAPKILPLLQSGEFLQAFHQKGRVSALLQNIPIHIVLNPKVGLIGSALYAAQRSAGSENA
ncbi:glucokinase [Acaryochloris sp. IP29b_bin.148]|uniref:glucokinase n=1 Tax=Acaryochloris sp. IP29b_bin.148 TaxID=2969218 RepID=UPI002619C835|nr:glucokinase [Acaryochloris sp. IP29b_bin.148]